MAPAEFPEQDELVLAVVKKILPYGAFCVLPEYNNMEAFLHVSEIAPRWIKNIHEFISEGQSHVTKIYHVDRVKNQVDISLKRVSEQEKRKKLELVRTEKRADKLIQIVISSSGEKINPEDVKKEIMEKFDSVYACFESALSDEQAITALNLPLPIIKQIIEVARKNIKKPEVKMASTLSLVCYGDRGIETIKKILFPKNKNISIDYLGAPNYRIEVTAKSYKEGEKMLSEFVEDIKSFAQKNNCELELEKAKK